MNKISKNEICKYTGDISQIFFAKQYRLNGGNADGMRVVDINNGSGLEFSLLVDRAMDIGRLSYKGTNMSFISKCGYTTAGRFDDKGTGWLKTFTAGFLTTCGLTQVGSPCECDGEVLGLHGRLTSNSAEELSVEVDLDQSVPEIVVKGKIRQGMIFGENLWLTREIKTKYGENKIWINDKIENRSGTICPFMVLYHFNLGYPLLDETIQLQTSAKYLRPRDEEAKSGEKNRVSFQKPEAGFKEQVYYYQNKAVNDGLSYAGIYNNGLDMGVKIWADPKQLPNLVQWKNTGFGDYVLGIEHGNCFPEGRQKQKAYGLAHIDPLEEKKQNLIIEIIGA